MSTFTLKVVVPHTVILLTPATAQTFHALIVSQEIGDRTNTTSHESDED